MKRFFGLFVWTAICCTLPGIGDASTQNSTGTNPASTEFERDVLPVLSKAGCNTGACHGALSGKGGFKLSLNGYDPKGDYYNIAEQAQGRRVELADPARSLLLTKPTGMLPHKGGLRLNPDSSEYRTLANWIAQGAPAPQGDAPQIVDLVVTPKNLRLKTGQTSPLKVIAKYSDGIERDVTRLAKYTSTYTPVVQVTENGIANVTGPGEASVVVWFSSRLALATVTSPFANDIADNCFAETPQRNFIDKLVLEKLRLLNLQPAERCTDTVFIRRAFIDTIGLLPTAEETRRFLADKSPNKRDRLIDHLLERDEFVDYWTYRWSDVFLISGKRLRPKAVQAYYQWLRGHIAADTPWDNIVRDVVTAKGDSFKNGATNFYALHQTPEDMAENVSQAFLGLSINCAKCHNHPLEKWTNDQYYAMANLFSRVRAKGWGGDPRNGDGFRTLIVVGDGELDQPLTGHPQPPTPLDGEPLSFDDSRDRREHLANWLTSPENPYFTRSVTNRIWANFMGRGLVEAVDDMRVSNPASNEKLLSAMSAYLIEHKYKLKELMRLILQSETYQRSSLATPQNATDDRFYSRYYPRRMMAEVLLDAVSQVTEVPTAFTKIEHNGGDIRKTDAYPIGTRAIELHDTAVISRFLSTFGRNKRDIVCECERSNKPSMVQVLHIANGSTINDKLADKTSCVARLFEQKPDSKQGDLQALDLSKIIENAYLSALSRFPSEAERKAMLKELEATRTATPAELRLAIEDLYWSLLSSREFIFQH